MEFGTITWFLDGLKDIIGHFTDEQKSPGDTGKSPWVTVVQTIIPGIIGLILALPCFLLTDRATFGVLFVSFAFGCASKEPTTTMGYNVRNFLTGVFLTSLVIVFLQG
jgi:hypothetical protein